MRWLDQLDRYLRRLNKAFGLSPRGVKDSNCMVCSGSMIVISQASAFKREVLIWSGTGFQCVACGRYVCDLCMEVNRLGIRKQCQCGRSQFVPRTYFSESNALRFGLI